MNIWQKPQDNNSQQPETETALFHLPMLWRRPQPAATGCPYFELVRNRSQRQAGTPRDPNRLPEPGIPLKTEPEKALAWRARSEGAGVRNRWGNQLAGDRDARLSFAKVGRDPGKLGQGVIAAEAGDQHEAELSSWFEPRGPSKVRLGTGEHWSPSSHPPPVKRCPSEHPFHPHSGLICTRPVGSRRHFPLWLQRSPGQKVRETPCSRAPARGGYTHPDLVAAAVWLELELDLTGWEAGHQRLIRED